MSPDRFRQELLSYRRPTREMIVNAGDPGYDPVTKISGVPWWPAGNPRPTCGDGHPMSFMAQFRLSDVPGFENHRDALASFHYCQQCAYDGNMSFGWEPRRGNSTGYDVRVIDDLHEKQPDGLGTPAEIVIEPHSVEFRNVLEVPGYEDVMNSLDLPSIPEDYPQGSDDFDENVYPGLVHIAKSKVGGWPTWVQHPSPPETKSQERLSFLGQLDWWLCDRATWCSGGYACLFLIVSENGPPRGELVIQTT